MIMNNKVFGTDADFSLIRQDGSRVVIAYGKTGVDAENGNSTWREVYLPKKQTPQLTIDVVKNAIIADINARTDEAILTGYSWNDKPVYLSTEYQFNFKAAYDLAKQTNGTSLPVTFKLGEDEDGTPVYHTFESVDELETFYMPAIAYINQCLNAGWQEKDAIDFKEYEKALSEL